MSCTFAAYVEAEHPELGPILRAVRWGPNFSNRNTVLILRSLGYGPEVIEQREKLDPREFAGRLALAIAVGGETADDGMPDISHHTEGGARLIDCGLRAGYFADAYERLAEFAEQTIAADPGVEIGWA